LVLDLAEPANGGVSGGKNNRCWSLSEAERFLSVLEHPLLTMLSYQSQVSKGRESSAVAMIGEYYSWLSHLLAPLRLAFSFSAAAIEAGYSPSLPLPLAPASKCAILSGSDSAHPWHSSRVRPANGMGEKM
jgi:hypothetical protein